MPESQAGRPTQLRQWPQAAAVKEGAHGGTRGPPWFDVGMRPPPFIYAAVFMQSFGFVAIVPLLADYEDRLGLSQVEVSAAFWAVGIVLLATAVPIGLLVDRLGARLVAIGGVALIALADLGQAFVDDFASLVVARAAIGLGTVGLWAAGQTWLAASVPERRRTAALGATMAFAGAG